eukprot:g3996.t1
MSRFRILLEGVWRVEKEVQRVPLYDLLTLLFMLMFLSMIILRSKRNVRVNKPALFNRFGELPGSANVYAMLVAFNRNLDTSLGFRLALAAGSCCAAFSTYWLLVGHKPSAIPYASKHAGGIPRQEGEYKYPTVPSLLSPWLHFTAAAVFTASHIANLWTFPSSHYFHSRELRRAALIALPVSGFLIIIEHVAKDDANIEQQLGKVEVLRAMHILGVLPLAAIEGSTDTPARQLQAFQTDQYFQRKYPLKILAPTGIELATGPRW